MSNGRSGSRAGVRTAIATIAITTALAAVDVAGANGSAVEHTLTGQVNTGPWSPPNEITIQTGDSVTWKFDPGSFHNVQSTGTNWPDPIPDDAPMPDHPAVTRTFSAAGVYTFVCDAHPGSMDGTITVQDPPPPPPPPPPPASPPPTADTVKPSVRSVALKALRNAVRVRFTLSEPATVTVRVKRRGSRKVLKSASVQAPAGTRSVTVRSKRLREGRYTVEIQARDASGNRSSLATKQLRVRR